MMKIINLLPKDKQKALLQRKLFLLIVSLIWLTAASFVVVLLVQFGTRAFLQGQMARLHASIEDLKQYTNNEENAAIKQKIKQLNDLVIDYKSLSVSIPKLSKVLRTFSPIVPEGVRITSFRIDPTKRTVDVNGYAPTREKVIDFYESVLANSKDFPNIDYPLENVAKRTDINFHFTFNVNEELLK
jgi:Tfp pilus assembly protein PilN